MKWEPFFVSLVCYISIFPLKLLYTVQNIKLSTYTSCIPYLKMLLESFFMAHLIHLSTTYYASFTGFHGQASDVWYKLIRKAFNIFQFWSRELYQLILVICTISISLHSQLTNSSLFLLSVFPVEKNCIKIVCCKDVHVTQVWPMSNKLEFLEISKKVLFLPCHFLVSFAWKTDLMASDIPSII